MSLIKEQDRKVIFLFGPTAVGKTQLLFDFFSGSGEVVNADSVQVYRHLDIGSAKADRSITDRIPHHLIDILDPWETYNVADFIRLADQACSGIWERGKLPVVSGGTAFYFKHFLYGLSEAPQSDPETRKTVELFIRDQGLDKAYDYLRLIDPVSAERINKNDSYRISRAIEVYRASGKPLSSFALPTVPRNDMSVLSIGLVRDKDELRKRIRSRVDLMFSQGIVDEIRSLLAMGATSSWQSMQGIGYREFLEKAPTEVALSSLSKTDLDDIREQIVMNSIHYAKRQMTFFRSFSDVRWINPEDTEDLGKTIAEFLNQR
ncbi:MAG: tRNA (adenosine(37)-N6)-dimethylallyltransferase MiaA [Spirochaetales bacterium]|nr:tRNA (adenosine(37)-N6)-dimethylallyltransferase MiaA [Spirochaetales bacterium]